MEFPNLDEEISFDNNRHPEESPAFQRTFKEKVQLLKEAYTEFGNPFLESKRDFFCIDTKITMDDDCVNNILGRFS